MNTLSTWQQIAIINWKEFHRAGLNKKRKIYDESGHRKEGFLKAEHYVIYNLLRDLPMDRGNPNASFSNPKTANLSIDYYEKLGMPFGMSAWTTKGLLQKQHPTA